MDETKTTSCKECTEEGDVVQIHAEVDHLQKHLSERDSHILALEAEIDKCNNKSNSLHSQLDTWQEKYDRLYDSHKRVQTLNQVLEDKLLQMVDRMKNDKTQLTKDVATLSVRLAESKHNYSVLQKENERFKNDMNLAIQLLQCKPDNFVSQKLDNLSVDTQARVSQYVMSKTRTGSTTSSQSKNGINVSNFDASEYEFNVSASLMSKILEDSIQDTVSKHCDSCTCDKAQNKPFCYDATHYSISTQTICSGEMTNALCLNCNSEIKSLRSNLSTASGSMHGAKLINEKMPGFPPQGPLYIIPQPLEELRKVSHDNLSLKTTKSDVLNDVFQSEEKIKLGGSLHKESITKIGEDLKQIRKSNGMSMEPAVHHKLCDRTKTPISSKISSNSLVNDDTVTRELPIARDTKGETDNQIDNISVRKNSLTSMGAVSRTSSVAKSSSSTHKSNTQVGPGPRFCSLRMQAGSKNILLDNAQPDVPPVLYRRQSKCNETTIFKDLTDGIDNFLEMGKNQENPVNFFRNDHNIVVESTLIDVHVDNNMKESFTTIKNTPINPVLMNVSSSPLQPLKTHTFSNGSEKNNNQEHSASGLKTTNEVDNLLTDFNIMNNNVSDIKYNDNEGIKSFKSTEQITPTENQDVKIFNFDHYEQNKMPSQYVRPFRKIEMSQLHSLENTKISKDLPPQGEMPKNPQKDIGAKANNINNIINVYPNLTQTHLKVNDNMNVFTHEKSTSSLSSDDSAAILQKQQLLRVAEWVEKNLEQQNNFNDLSLEEDASFNAKIARRESRLNRLTDTLNELALNMPHPVSKYSKSSKEELKKAVTHNNNDPPKYVIKKSNSDKVTNVINVATETIFPAEESVLNNGEASNDVSKVSENMSSYELSKNLNDVLNGDKEITADDLARMEYNVKKFLLSGPQWINSQPVGRSRRTSSKTETDV